VQITQKNVLDASEIAAPGKQPLIEQIFSLTVKFPTLLSQILLATAQPDSRCESTGSWFILTAYRPWVFELQGLEWTSEDRDVTQNSSP